MYQTAKLKQQQASALEWKSAGFLHKEEEDRQGNERRMMDRSIEVLFLFCFSVTLEPRVE